MTKQTKKLNLRTATAWTEAFRRQRKLIYRELAAFPEPSPYDGSTWFTDWLTEIDASEKIWQEEEAKTQVEIDKLLRARHETVALRLQNELKNSPQKKEFIKLFKANDPGSWLDW